MTCIIGLVDDGNVYIGADSAGVAGSGLSIRSDPKVFIRDDFIMGFTGSFRMGQLLRYNLQVAYRPEITDILEYMVKTFVEAVRRCLKGGGFAEKKDDREKGGTFLVGYQGRLFRIGSDYQVGENKLPFDVVGCGEDIAQGSLYSNGYLKPKERILQALEAAEQFSSGVRRPFLIERLNKD